MSNPYSYDGPDTRWAAGDPTTAAGLNIARVNLDAVKVALAALVSFSEWSDPGSWFNPLVFGGSGGLYIWADITNQVVRIKDGSVPANEADGDALATV